MVVYSTTNTDGKYPVINEFVHQIGDECIYVLKEAYEKETIRFIKIYESRVGTIIF